MKGNRTGVDRLRVELEELRASRARLLSAADADRRAIERELHDGVQQHLVALAANLQVARQLAGSDPAAAKTLLEEMAGDVRQALEEVRELAQRIYPALLEAGGLTPALRAAAEDAGIRVKVDAAGAEPCPSEVGATVYFCCLEALRNAAAHAGAGAQATISVRQEGDALLFEVADDGAGFDPVATPRGPGLTRIGDRISALGGRLTIASEPGQGTRVSGRLPLRGAGG